MFRPFLFLLFFCGVSLSSSQHLSASPADTLRLVPDAQHLSLETGATVGRILVFDQYQKLWQKGKDLQGLQIGLRYHTQASDSCSFAAEYGYPEWGLTLSWGNFSQVTMHKQGSWGQAKEVGYTSHMGQLFSLFGSFSRPLLRSPRWQIGYALEEGLAYNTRPYRRADNVDNELTGSAWLIYFGASLYGSYQINTRWALRGDLAFRHVSNGATQRPNKGANWLAPTLSLHYRLDTPAPFVGQGARPAPFAGYWYATVGGSVGVRTLLEEWLRTQYNTPPDDPEYRSETFRKYLTLNLQADFMRRYARRWASGIGVDFFYLNYVDRLRELDGGASSRFRYSPWSLGIAAKHEAFYGPLSLYVSLGYYLHRQTGSLQAHDETPYYERIGLRYRFPQLRGVSLGIGVKAHRTKADFTEITLSYDL